MKRFTKHTGKCVPIYEQNIDTDQIVPKKFLLSVKRTGYEKALFYDWRFNQNGSPKTEFALNRKKFKNASVLITGANFGCGSSREHAPWALQQYGFRVIIAPSFADIFYNNCFKIGLLPVKLDEKEITAILQKTKILDGYSLKISLEEMTIQDDQGFHTEFFVSDFRRHSLLNGLDDIALTLMKSKEINSHEKTRLDFLEKP